MIGKSVHLINENKVQSRENKFSITAPCRTSHSLESTREKFQIHITWVPGIKFVYFIFKNNIYYGTFALLRHDRMPSVIDTIGTRSNCIVIDSGLKY